MFIHDWDAADDDEWRSFLASHRFGELIAAGRGRDVPIVVPTQFTVVGHDVVLHLLRRNPVWDAVDENPRVVLAVSGDWAFIPSSWKAIADEDPALGIPTTYYASVQLVGTARTSDDPAVIAEVLRLQLADLQPGVATVDPEAHGARLRAIRALRFTIDDVRAKFKYGGNVDAAHRLAVAARLDDRGGPGDREAAAHLRRRLAAGGAT